MPLSRWSSLRILVGGGVITLVAVVWGTLHWQIPHWFVFIASIPFVFAAAILRHPRVYFYILLAYMLSHVMVDLWTGDRSFMVGSDAVQWVSLAISGEVIYQLSTQRRRAERIAQQRISELEMMNTTLMEISSELELKTLLQTIMERAVKLLNASLGELLLYDKQTGEMEIVAQYPINQSQVGFKMKPGEGAMGRVAVTKRPLILNDYKAFVNALSDPITTGVEATLDVPLLRSDEFIGVLGVARHARNYKFTLDDQSLLTVFANQATIAIGNARLYEEVQRLAFTDMLTNINNRRRLFELADKEYKRSVRYRRPLSFMLVDIDHFKSINDTYGHAAGDEVLKWFASICNMVIRQKVDVLGRFGGEEFAFIYPETDLPSAVNAAERLRKHFVNMVVAIPGHELMVTFSAGIASLPFGEDIALDQLIERADKALYFAKRKRNCSAYWDDGTNAPVFAS
jgi:diguanylate cyclase (GGDEF)-like protein